MNLKPFLVVVAVMLLVDLVAADAFIDLYPVKDARIEDDDHSNINYGSAFQLKVGKYTSNTMRSYFTWNLSSLDDLELQGAELMLYSIGGSGSPVIELYNTSNSWSEDGITWDTAPAFGELISSAQVDNFSGYISFDVSDFIQSEIAANNQLVSIATKAANETLTLNYRIFFSKENPSNKPLLRVYYIPSSPVVTSYHAPLSADEGSRVELNFTAEDPNNDISFYGIYLDGELLSDSYSATWQPNYQDSGTHKVVFFVNDSTGLSDNVSLSISITDVKSIVINEFLPYSSPPGEEWIELYNPLNTSFSVNSCYIKDAAGFVVPLTGIISSYSYGLVTNLSILNNEGDMVALYCDDILIDSVAYGGFDDGNTADNAPVADVAESLGRKSDGYDTDNDKNDFKLFTEPSFGFANQVYHDADTNRDGCVSMEELLAYIGLWKADPTSIPLEELLSAIALWKSNPIC